MALGNASSSTTCASNMQELPWLTPEIREPSLLRDHQLRSWLHDHQLVHGVHYSCGVWACDRCHSRFDAPSPGWYCVGCGFDACIDCYQHAGPAVPGASQGCIYQRQHALWTLQQHQVALQSHAKVPSGRHQMCMMDSVTPSTTSSPSRSADAPSDDVTPEHHPNPQHAHRTPSSQSGIWASRGRPLDSPSPVAPRSLVPDITSRFVPTLSPNSKPHIVRLPGASAPDNPSEEPLTPREVVAVRLAFGSPTHRDRDQGLLRDPSIAVTYDAESGNGCQTSLHRVPLQSAASAGYSTGPGLSRYRQNCGGRSEAGPSPGPPCEAEAPASSASASSRRRSSRGGPADLVGAASKSQPKQAHPVRKGVYTPWLHVFSWL